MQATPLRSAKRNHGTTIQPGSGSGVPTNPQGKSGWVPQSYIERSGNTGTMHFDYSTQELTVTAGEIVTGAKEESGWAWCTTQQSKSGWVPLNCLARPE